MRPVLWGLIALGIIVLAAVIHEWHSSRQTTCEQGAAEALRLMEDGLQRAGIQKGGQTVSIEIIGANKASQAIGAPGALQPER